MSAIFELYVCHLCLQVWESGKPWLVDYINIPVGNAIEPSLESLTVGSVVCYTVPLTSQSGMHRAQSGVAHCGQCCLLHCTSHITVRYA